MMTFETFTNVKPMPLLNLNACQSKPEIVRSATYIPALLPFPMIVLLLLTVSALLAPEV